MFDSNMKTVLLGDLAFESKARAGGGQEPKMPVYGVDRRTGLMPAAKYSSSNLSRYKVLKPGSFAYNPMRLNIGSIAYCSEKHEVGLVSPDYVVFECKGGLLDPKFLRYFIDGEDWQQWTASAGVGSVRVRIYFRELAKMPLKVPSFEKQKRSAHILATLDNRIELNRRMNATLEAMAGALFQSWFVDFDPVKSNAQNGSPRVEDKLFPDSFEDSPLGAIPRGWEVGTIDDATSLIIDYRGRTPKKMGSDWSEDGIPAISAKNVKGGRLVRPETFNYVSEELYGKWMKDKLTQGDVLMTSEAPLGELYYLALDARYCLSQRVFALRADPSCCESTFLYHWLSLPSCQTEMAGRGTGSTVVGIRQSELRKVRVLLPPLAVQKAASGFLTPWVEQVHRNEDQNRNLSALRDALLPKMLRGDLSTNELETISP